MVVKVKEAALQQRYLVVAPQAEEFAQTFEEEHESRSATTSSGVLAEAGASQATPAGPSAHQAPLAPQPAASPAAGTAAESAPSDAHTIAVTASAQREEPDSNDHSDREDSSPEELAAAVAASQQWPRVIRSANLQ